MKLLGKQINNEIYPNQITIWHDEATVDVGGAITFAVTTQFYQNPSVINDRLSWQIRLRSGVYTFHSFGNADTVQGIATWRLDSTIIATHDWYSGVSANNTYKSTSDISIEGGYYTLSMTMESKNELSGGFIMQAVKHWFIRTGE